MPVGDTRIQIPEEVARARAEGEAKKIFRLQVAINLISNEKLAEYADSCKTGAAKAHALLERSLEVALKYMNEE